VDVFELVHDGGVELRLEAALEHRLVRDLVEKLFVLAIHAREGYHQAMHIAPAGDRAVLLDLGDVTAEELHAANASVQRVRGVVRSIPGHSSLYVIFEGAPDLDALRDLRQPPAANRQRPATHDIPVDFNGPDLEEFLRHAGITREAFFARIPDVRLIARYLGFRGGFAYLDGWPSEWSMPRRPTSRPVAAGSFAIAGNVAAFYPIDSPGGWNVLGVTDVDLENAIAPGDELRLERRAGFSPPPRPRGGLKPALRHEIVAPLATWTDTPFDDVAATLANHAVGNDAHAPLLECPLVGPRIRFTGDAVIAWCSPALDLSIERVKAGDERAFGRIAGGLRAYLAIGSRERPVALLTREDRHTIRARNGPHDRGLTRVECEVTPQLDRVGIRLRPLQPLDVPAPADLKSIGMQCGTVQLHPDGSLVAMGPEHPVTGGYLQPMTVLTAERWKLAQLVPGERVTFVTS
jgi:allophanate hydrolase subunit 1